MSNAILPAITPTSGGSGWNWKLPLKCFPSFKTLVQTPANNRGELRISLTQWPIWLFEMEIPYIFGDPETINSGYQELIGFYGQVQGQADDWLFDWPDNNQITTPQVIGIGDGVTVTTPIYHGIGGMNELIQNFKSLPNDLYRRLGTESQFIQHRRLRKPYVQYGTSNGQQVAWIGSWYTRCRFLEDELQDLQLIRAGSNPLWTLKSLKFKSVLI